MASAARTMFEKIWSRHVVADFRRQLHERPGATITVDLDAQTATGPDRRTHRFEVDGFRKHMLLTGQDEIALTLGYESAIAAYEARRRVESPWLETPSAPPAR